MYKAPAPKDPASLSYLALRKLVGYVALVLPFAVSLPRGLLHHTILTSISAYYYTSTRNVFVGALCAIGVFMLCTRGYDRWDEIAGLLSGVFAVGVALCPTSPDTCATHRQTVVGYFHYSFAAALFLTLAFFCLFLFKMSAENHTVTPEKIKRNGVYTVCGIVILISLASLLAMTRAHVEYVFGHIAPGILFETTSLLAFGAAWIVKGEQILKDKPQPPAVA